MSAPPADVDRVPLLDYMCSLLEAGSTSRGLVYKLVGLQFPGGITPLMVAAAHPDSRRAVQLIDLLLANGADLGAKDHCGRQVLLFVCGEGVHPRVVESLLRWNRKRAGWELQWGHRDCFGNHAVALASHSGNAQLLAFLLSKYARQTRHLEEFPLRLLQAAIESRDEHSAGSVLTYEAIQLEIRQSSMIHTLPRDPRQRTHNLFTCVEAAVRCGMPRLVLAMHRLNPEEARRAVWYALYKLQVEEQTLASFPDTKQVDVAPELSRLAQRYRQDWLWNQVHAITPLRRLPVLSGRTRQGSIFRRIQRRLRHKRHVWKVLATHPLATLPDEIFGRILSFLRLPEAEEADKLRFSLEARACPVCMTLYIPEDADCQCSTSTRWFSARWAAWS